LIRPGPARARAPRRFLTALRTSPALKVSQAVLLFMILAAVAVHGADSMGYNWQWGRVLPYIFTLEDGRFTAGPLLLGLVETLRISGWSLVLAVAIGLATAILRMSDSFAGRGLARAYIGLIRNTPLLVQLNLFYFIASPIFDIGRLWTGILCLAAFEGAYASEIFRSGILAVRKGQWEASAGLGLSSYQTYRFVVLPQALRIMLPPLTGVGVSLIKDSAIVSVIALAELTTAARNAISDSFMSFEIWLTVAAIYLVLTVSISIAANLLEARLRLTTCAADF
jgi:polar amino acid transport system permease protein